jgi:tRNA A-37 threonylcarbamoyl transferase component Bud32/tetratricopeptide (TPR) repeat protein
MSRNPAREEAIFSDALTQPEAHRAAFLDTACGDDRTLRARVMSLLAAHARSDSLAMLATSNFPAMPDEKCGNVIGRYKLLQKIGEGGCGVVWMAEQEEPVRRRVALKVIKLGMDTREVIARFSAERQALAMMDHPGIAKVLDAGSTQAGRPYFVMDLVRGVKITKYCDDQQLDVTARLSLFVQVCDAVQHAHQKGIIHRDLKPSNILVSLVEKTPIPRVIDFGIAKATQGRLTEATLVTAVDQFIGTPAYMSPEQAASPSFDIDTRSDVYSLGILLYELLVGQTPFDPRTLVQSSPDELRRIIREVEPAKLSTQFRTLTTDEKMRLAKARTTDPARLAATLAGDLDWIVIRALEKNRARRYETPSALADDIGRHLSHQLVVARPPGTFYRMGKFTRRHRLGVFAAAVVVLVLIAGTVVSTLLAVRATKAEHVAKEERTRAKAAAARAEALIDFMLGEFRNEVQKVGKLDLLESVGDKATAYFSSLDPRDLDEKTLLQQARTLRQIGEIRMAQARYAQAILAFSTANRYAATLVSRNPKNGEMLFERAQTEYWIGFVHRKRGDVATMGDWFARYRDTGVALVALDPKNASSHEELAYGHHNLAVFDLDEGRFDAARRGFVAELETLAAVVQDRPQDRSLQFRVIDANSWLGTIAERTGNFPLAIEQFARQVASLELMVQDDPGTAKWRAKLADALALHATVLAITGRRADSLALRNRASALLEALVTGDPENRTWEMALAYLRLREARLLRAEGHMEKARQLIDETRGNLERLAAKEPTDKELAGRLATAWRLQAELLEATEGTGAMEAATRAVQLGESLIREMRASDEIIGETAQALLTVGRLSARSGSRESALAHWRRAVELVEERLPASNNWRILDPAARVFAVVGQGNRQRAIIEQLQHLGYAPLEPWP